MASRLYDYGCGFLDLMGERTLCCMSDIYSDPEEAESKRMMELCNGDAAKDL